MTEHELDEILTFRWPVVMRRVMACGNSRDKGFVMTIRKYGKRPTWSPSVKQEMWMRDLLDTHCGFPSDEIEVIER